MIISRVGVPIYGNAQGIAICGSCYYSLDNEWVPWCVHVIWENGEVLWLRKSRSLGVFLSSVREWWGTMAEGE